MALSSDPGNFMMMMMMMGGGGAGDRRRRRRKRQTSMIVVNPDCIKGGQGNIDRNFNISGDVTSLDLTDLSEFFMHLFSGSYNG